MKLLDKYDKPTPKPWRRLGDTALLLAIAVEPMIQTMPLEGVSKEWIVWVFTTGLIILKFLTNIVSEK